MDSIFISHSSKDNDHAVAIQEWLKQSGWANSFLDINPEEGLLPGQRWQAELTSAISRCHAMLILISPNWAASEWCKAEFLLAKSSGKQIFPVVIAPVSLTALPTEMLAEFQVVDISSADARDTRLQQLANGLKSAGIHPDHFEWPPKGHSDRAPYRGLEVYEPMDAAVFFGRDAYIGRTLDQLRSMRQRGGQNLLVLLGASGSGKSSFLRAGLIARLNRLEHEFVTQAAFRPGADDLQKLVAAPPAPQQDSPRPPSPVLPIDQAEEVFALDPEAADRFWRALTDKIAANPDQLIVMAIRSDSFHLLHERDEFNAMNKQFIELPPIEKHQWPDLITEPARIAGKGKTFNQTLVDRIVADHERTAALPLLAYSLKQLYIATPDGGEAGAEQYDALGGLKGILDNQISKALGRWAAEHSGENVAAAVSAVFIPWLVTTDPASGRPRRRVARLSDIPSAYAGLVRLLIDERLLVSGSGASADATVEVAHESLFDAWPLLSRTIEQQLGVLNASRKFISDVVEWQTAGYRSEFLVYKGERLRSIIALLDKSPALISGYEKLAAFYLWQCVRIDVPSSRRMKYVFLVFWVAVVAVGGLMLR